MEIIVKISKELAAQVRASGLQVEIYVQEILAQYTAVQSKTYRQRTPEEIRTWLDSLAQFSDKIAPLPETISREWIYCDEF